MDVYYEDCQTGYVDNCNMQKEPECSMAVKAVYPEYLTD